MNPEPPVYQFEVAFFRRSLGVSYESGCRLRLRGILLPDALMAEGRRLYRVDPQSIRQAQERIAAYRAQVAKSRHNLPLCHEKAVTV